MTNLAQQLQIEKVAGSLKDNPALYERQIELVDYMSELKSQIRKEVTGAFQHLTNYRSDVPKFALTQALESVEFEEALGHLFDSVADVVSRYEMANSLEIISAA